MTGTRTIEQPDLDSLEQVVLKQLAPELAEHLKLVQDAYNLIGKTVASLPKSSVREMPLSRRVGEALMRRLANDLRSAALLASRGYALQAATLVASIFEIAYTIAYIGNDDERAANWTKHEDPTQPFVSISRLLIDVLKAEADETGNLELQCYSQLCMAKHVNPLLQKHHGVRESEAAIEVFGGPDAGTASIRAAWYALDNGVRLASIAIHYVAEAHAAAGQWPRDEYAELTAGWEQLAAAARDRGWAEDPLPEESWRKLKK